MNLRRGIAQPHRINIAGDDKRIRPPVFHLKLNSGVQRIGKAVFKHPG
jgi:hypothetical protein